jgi:hypothetical protein
VIVRFNGDRAVAVDTIGDADAALAVEPSAIAGGAYTTTDDGMFAIQLTGTGDPSAGTGVNSEAVTQIENLFHLRNQGVEQIYVHLESSLEGVRFGLSGPVKDGLVRNSPTSRVASGETVTVDRSENAVQMTPAAETPVHMRIDTTGNSTLDGPLNGTVTIRATMGPPAESPF